MTHSVKIFLHVTVESHCLFISARPQTFREVIECNIMFHLNGNLAQLVLHSIKTQHFEVYLFDMNRRKSGSPSSNNSGSDCDFMKYVNGEKI